MPEHAHILTQPQPLTKAIAKDISTEQKQINTDIYFEGLEKLPLQRKLSIGATDDPLEHEADAMADKVMRMPEPFIQRKCSCEDEEKVQRKPLDTFIRRKEPVSNSRTSDTVSGKIASTRGGGSPMPESTRNFMESRFGTNFSDVRIHTGGYASQLSRELNAEAFTVGKDVYFNEGRFSTESTQGKQLLAHELTHTIQQQGNKNSNVQRQVSGRPTSATSSENQVNRVSISCNNLLIAFHTADKRYVYHMNRCNIPLGTYETSVTVHGNRIHWDFGQLVDQSRRFHFNFIVAPGQTNPATLFHNQQTVSIQVVPEIIINPLLADERLALNIDQRLHAFKMLVKNAGRARMQQNRQALLAWKTFFNERLTPRQLQTQVLGQETRDLILRAEHAGPREMEVAEQMVQTNNPVRRFARAEQLQGRCRGGGACHLERVADDAAFRTPLSARGEEWLPLAERLRLRTQEDQINPAPRPSINLLPQGPGEGWQGWMRINNPSRPGLSSVSQSLDRLQPYLRALGPQYYGILPQNIISSNISAQALLAEINTRIEDRRTDYQNFANAIASPAFDYLKLRPIVRDLLPLADDEVKRRIQREIEHAETWELVKAIIFGLATIALLLLIIFPPTSAIGIAGVVALEGGMGLTALVGGIEQFMEGRQLRQARGADDVIDREQQEAASTMMAMGAFQIVMGALGLRGAAMRGLRLRQLPPSGNSAAGGAGAGVVDELEGMAGSNRIRITSIASGEPNVIVKNAAGEIIYEGPLRSMPHSGFAAAGEAAAADAGSALNNAQRRAAALQSEALQQEQLAAEKLRNAGRANDPAARTRLNEQATGHQTEATRLRVEAEDVLSGRRSATDVVPTSAEFDAAIENATSPNLPGSRPLRIPVGANERFSEAVIRIERAVLRTARGRVVFRVQGGGSQELVTIGADGSVTIPRGSTLNANFGSLERALEYLRTNRNVPGARIIAFEVDEAFARSLRSSAIPEHGATNVPGSRTQLVDVSHGPDQLQIPASVIDDLSNHVIPNSGKVLLVN